MLEFLSKENREKREFNNYLIMRIHCTLKFGTFKKKRKEYTIVKLNKIRINFQFNDFATDLQSKNIFNFKLKRLLLLWCTKRYTSQDTKLNFIGRQIIKLEKISLFLTEYPNMKRNQQIIDLCLSYFLTFKPSCSQSHCNTWHGKSNIFISNIIGLTNSRAG